MDLRRLQYFVAVVEQGSFSRAAVSLNLAQPSVSRQVALLEQELGQRLLERTGRRVVPTAAGNTLLAHARVMLNASAQAISDLKQMGDDPVGRVVVGLPNWIAMAICVPLIRQFRERFPRAMLSIVEGLSPAIQDGLLVGRIDLALLFDPAPTPLLAYEDLMREPMVLIAPRHYRLPATLDWRALSNYPLALPGVHNPIRRLVDASLAPQRIALNIVAEIGAVHSALTIVEHGLACSILPEGALRLCGHPERIRSVRVGPPVMRNRLVLAVPRARPASRLVSETLRLLRNVDLHK